MPEPAGHCFQRNSPRDKERSVRVAQTVDIHVRKPLAHDELVEPRGQRLGVQHSAVPRRENALALLPERAAIILLPRSWSWAQESAASICQPESGRAFPTRRYTTAVRQLPFRLRLMLSLYSRGLADKLIPSAVFRQAA